MPQYLAARKNVELMLKVFWVLWHIAWKGGIMKQFLFWVWGMLILFLAVFTGRDTAAVSSNFWYYRDSAAQSCRDIEFVFARGSGQAKDTGPTFIEFKERMAAVAQSVHASYRVTDLDYEAVAIRTDNVLGIYASAGEAYDFGASVDDGVSELWRYYNSHSSCNRTHWVLGGYSQGAMVVANALSRLDSSRVVYVSLFGDPKLYLPEGKGFNPPACRGQNLSAYRMYVPNCDTDNGILGERNPYEISGFEGLMGLWCNQNDFICGSSKNPLRNGGHSQYVTNGSIYHAATVTEDRLHDIRPDHVVASADESSFRLAKTKIRKTGSASIKPKISALEITVNLGLPVMLSVANEDSSLNYEWIIDGQTVASGGVLYGDYFNSVGVYAVKLLASDGDNSSYSYAVVHVITDGSDDDRLPSPVTTAIQRDDNSFRVSWTDIPERARYFGIRVKDYFLGYTEASNGEIIINDVNFDDVSAGCFWFTEEMDMGYPAEITIERLGSESGVVTSATASPWQKAAIVALPFLGGLTVIIVLKTIRDFERIKNAPRIKPESVRREVCTALMPRRRASMRATLNRIRDGSDFCRPSIRRYAWLRRR